MKQLHEHPNAGQAREELERRGVTSTSAEAFRLGYAPHGWDALTNWLKTQEISVHDAEDLGLLVPRKNGTGYYDRFRHRLMFPVSDHMGRIVAFSGRVLDPPPDEPLSDRMDPAAKYVNSPENPLFKKGNVLFGLHEGRVEIRRDGWVVVCEGNFDLVGLHQAEFRNAVAPLGTALTAEHCRLLKRFAQRVILLFDGDKAGRKAVRASFPLLQAQNLEARVVRLPEGQDPDSFLRQEGADALRRRIEAAPSIVEFLIDDQAANAGGDPAARARAIEELGSVLSAIDNPVEARLYVERIAQKFGISDIEAVRRQLRRGVRSHRDQEQRQARSRGPLPSEGRGGGGTPTRTDTRAPAHGAAMRENSSPPARRPLNSLEQELVGVLLDQPSLFDTEDGQRLGELLTTGELSHIFHNAKKIAQGRGVVDAPALLGVVEPSDTRTWLEGRLAVQVHEIEVAKESLSKGVLKLAAERIAHELPRMSEEIQAARRAGDEERAMVLTRERDRLFRSASSVKKYSSATNEIDRKVMTK